MNKAYTIYETKTGKILRQFGCKEGSIPDGFSPDTESIIEGDYGFTQRINLDTLQAESIPLVNVDYPVYHITDLIQYIQDDVVLDKAIQNLGENPVTYKQDNYSIFRRWVYPDYTDFLDAFVKQQDNKTKQEGDAQMESYVQKCKIVKNRFPKKIE